MARATQIWAVEKVATTNHTPSRMAHLSRGDASGAAGSDEGVLDESTADDKVIGAPR